MKNKKICVFINSIAVFLLFMPYVLSQESTLTEGKNIKEVNHNVDEISEFKKQLLDLQKQIIEMRQTHEKEIKALTTQIKEIQKTGTVTAEKESDVKSLRHLAEAEAEKEEYKEKLEETIFKQAGLALQKLNPEISITGDIVNTYAADNYANRFNFNFRNLGIHFEAYMDPYTRFKAAIPVTTSTAKIGEAYFTRYGVMNNVNLTMGKFRQQFGVVNRWHKHALDQVDFPLALRQIFGSGGLNQTGVSLDWAMPPLGNSSQELVFQVTNGENDRLFSGNVIGIPSMLAHYKNYRNLSRDVYMEFGLTGLVGWNREWDVSSGSTTITKEDSKHTAVYGADLSFLWEPADNMRYRNLEWRSELYWLNRDILAPDNSGADVLNSWGAYTYLQSRVSRTLDIGTRFDFYKPDTKTYAGTLSPLAYTEDTHQWQISPYITWHQSPFVKFRLEYNHLESKHLEKPEDRIMLQAVFAIGPHKHERY